MPFLFAVVGVLLIVAGVRNTLTAPANPNLVSLVRDDLTGTPNYLEWMTAIFIVGAVGYIPQLRTLSRGFMALIVIGLLWSNKGFFAAFSAQTSGAESAPISESGNGGAALTPLTPLGGTSTQPASSPSLTLPQVFNGIFGPSIG